MRFYKRIFCCIAALLPPLLLHSLEPETLNRFSRTLDNVEQNFWRGIFSAPGSSARRYLEELVDSLHLQSQEIQRKRGNYYSRALGNTTVKSGKLRILVHGHQGSPVKNALVTMRRTTESEYRRTLKKDPLNREWASKPVDPGRYRVFLDSVREQNMEKFSRRFSSFNSLSRAQFIVLSKLAEEYMEALTDLRMTILLLRKQECSSE